MKMKDYYSILNVPTTATENDIKAAYRRLAKKFHPDKNPSDTNTGTRFKEISEAYETLGNPARRREYDEMRRSGGRRRRPDPRNAQASSANADMGWSHSAPFSDTAGGPDIQEILAAMFGGAGDPLHSHAADARRRGYAGFADATGRKEPGTHIDLPVNLAQLLLGSALKLNTPAKKTIVFRIPAGTQPDTVFRIPSQGHPSSSGPEDLYLHVRLSLPGQLNEGQRELVRELAASLGLKH